MNDPKTAGQINSQVSDTPNLDDLRALVRSLTLLLDDPHPGLSTWAHFYGPAMQGLSDWWNCDYEKRNIALRLLVEKWREASYNEDISHPNPPMLNSMTLRRCAKELEEALSGL